MEPLYLIIIVLLGYFLFIFTRKLILYRKKKQNLRNLEIEFKLEQELLETVTKSDRGTIAERDLVVKLLKSEIPPQTIFHDLYIKKPNGNFSQIDLVVVTTAGIIVFEVKDYSGWIFGTGYQPQWTQVLSYGNRKYRFYNPIMQNNKHIADLRRTLKQFEKIPFYSVIVFAGDCKLRDINFVPEGTFVVKMERVLEVIKILKEKEPAPYTNKHDVIRVLKEAVENGANKETGIRHGEKVKDMLGKHRVFD